MRAVEHIEIASAAVGDRFRLTLVEGEPGSPAIYVLDPIFLFDVAVGAAQLLRTSARLTGGPFPNVTIVGVGYPSEEPGEVFRLRARDLTPTDGQRTSAVQLPPLSFGGAERFLTALAEELVPSVESRCEVDSTRRALVGFSFGGLFALYALFHRPGAFSRFLVGSPSLWWDDGIAFEYEEQWFLDHRDLEARLFFWVGANEELVGDSWKNEGFPLDALRRLKQVTNLRKLTERLRGRKYAGLQVEAAVFEGEYHLTAPASGLTRGLLMAFEE